MLVSLTELRRAQRPEVYPVRFRLCSGLMPYRSRENCHINSVDIPTYNSVYFSCLYCGFCYPVHKLTKNSRRLPTLAGTDPAASEGCVRRRYSLLTRPFTLFFSIPFHFTQSHVKSYPVYFGNFNTMRPSGATYRKLRSCKTPPGGDGVGRFGGLCVKVLLSFHMRQRY